MNRLTKLTCGTVLLVCTSTMLAQHPGGGGARRGSSKSSSSEDLRDFKRTMALQAAPEQVRQFKEGATNAQAAKKAAQDLLQLSANASDHNFSHSAEALSSAVEAAQTSNEKFLQTFTRAQKSGLKDLMKNLGKATSEISKQSKALGPAAAQSDAKQIASLVGKLDAALSDFEARRSAIADEMGIQGETTSQ